MLKKFSQSSLIKYIAGIIVGLCFAHLSIFLFVNIFSFYKNSNDHKFGKARLLHLYDREYKAIADQLFNDVRVLCWVATYPSNHDTKAQHVKETWGRRCNKLIFMSSVEDMKLGTVALPVEEGRDNLWAKTKEAFKYIYKHDLNEYDWFLKADDDTYVIVENLRKMLYAYNPEFPIYLGSKFKKFVNQGYMSGGAGYVLSREALKRFVEKELVDTTKCSQEADCPEDVKMGQSMENLKVIAVDSRDEYGRVRMFPFTPDRHLLTNPSIPDYWYWNYIYYKTDKGFDYCSDHAVSFHYLKPYQIYLFDYLIYHLRPFGLKLSPDILPQKKSLNDIINALYNSSNKSSK